MYIYMCILPTQLFLTTYHWFNLGSKTIRMPLFPVQKYESVCADSSCPYRTNNGSQCVQRNQRIYALWREEQDPSTQHSENNNSWLGWQIHRVYPIPYTLDRRSHQFMKLKSRFFTSWQFKGLRSGSLQRSDEGSRHLPSQQGKRSQILRQNCLHEPIRLFWTSKIDSPYLQS